MSGQVWRFHVNEVGEGFENNVEPNVGDPWSRLGLELKHRIPWLDYCQLFEQLGAVTLEGLHDLGVVRVAGAFAQGGPPCVRALAVEHLDVTRHEHDARG